jgi:hypothetical protein
MCTDPGLVVSPALGADAGWLRATAPSVPAVTAAAPAFALRERLQRGMQFPYLPGRVDLLHQPVDVVGVEQPVPRDQGLRLTFPHRPAQLGRDDVARDPVQPRPRSAEGTPVTRRRVDHGEEHLGGQVRGQVRIRHPARHEPGHLVRLRAVELAERSRVGPDRPYRRLGPWIHQRPLQ